MKKPKKPKKAPRLKPGVVETIPKTLARPGTKAYAPFQWKAFGKEEDFIKDEKDK
jgi:hypothetical protein